MSQKTRTLLTLGSLLVIAAGTGAWAYWGVYLAEEEEAARADAAERLVQLEKDEVLRLEIKAGAGPLHLEKVEGDWRLVRPVEAPADRAAVEALLDRLVSARRTRTLDAAEPAKYGLEAPGLQVTISDGAGTRETVAIGASNDFDGSIFVRDAKDRVGTAPGSLRSALNKSPFHLREKRIVVFGTDAVASVELSNGVRLEREGDGWHLVGEAKERADEEEVGALLRALQDLRATAFAAEAPEDLAPWGLDEPRLRVRLALAEGPTLSLAFGQEDEKAYVRLDEGPVAQVAPSIWEKLEKDADDLRDRRLFSYDSSRVARVIVEKEDSRLELERGQKGWRLPAAPDAKVLTWRAAAVVSTLRSLRAETLAPLGADPAVYGLDAPTATVVAIDGNGEEMARLLVGRREGTSTWVQAAGAPRIARIETGKLTNVLVDQAAVVESGDGEASQQAASASAN